MRRLEEETRRSGNAFEAIRHVVGEYARMFAAIEDPYFRDRGADVEDVGQRVVSRLLGVRHHDRPLTDGAVVVASNLLPAHFATLDVEKVVLKAKTEKKAKKAGATEAKAEPKLSPNAAAREKKVAQDRHAELMHLIEAAEGRIAEIDGLFADPAFYERTPKEEVRGLEKERTGLNDEVATLMAEWERTEEKIRALG